MPIKGSVHGFRGRGRAGQARRAIDVFEDKAPYVTDGGAGALNIADVGGAAPVAQGVCNVALVGVGGAVNEALQKHIGEGAEYGDDGFGRELPIKYPFAVFETSHRSAVRAYGVAYAADAQHLLRQRGKRPAGRRHKHDARSAAALKSGGGFGRKACVGTQSGVVKVECNKSYSQFDHRTNNNRYFAASKDLGF